MKPISPEQTEKLGKTLGYFKLNIPSSIEDYQTNNGEGIWATVRDPKLKKRIDNDEVIKEFVAYACNDSVYYPHIKCGDPIIATQRGI